MTTFEREDAPTLVHKNGTLYSIASAGRGNEFAPNFSLKRTLVFVLGLLLFLVGVIGCAAVDVWERGP